MEKELSGVQDTRAIHPNQLSAEEFLALPAGTIVEFISGDKEYVSRLRVVEHLEKETVFNRLYIGGDIETSVYHTDMGLVPYSGGSWNKTNYVRLAK